jgi:hypothetical protein
MKVSQAYQKLERSVRELRKSSETMAKCLAAKCLESHAANKGGLHSVLISEEDESVSNYCSLKIPDIHYCIAMTKSDNENYCYGCVVMSLLDLLKEAAEKGHSLKELNEKGTAFFQKYLR